MLTDDFQQAVANSKTLSQKPDNETLLKLYGLYKQATEGDVGGEAPSNMFDFVGKAKYEAWDALRGTTKEAAMEAYIQLVNSLKE
jgi:diazepam-binding inhibitor (GABA receptor modulating acyl-CoA-binding protein)